MAVQVLATRLRPPPVRARTVARRRLLRRLDEGVERTLTVVSAPAGYGKTTLVSAWVTERDAKAAWLSVSSDDDEPAQFLLYLIAAIRMADIDVTEDLVTALRSSRPPAPEAVLVELINAIQGVPENVVLVLDDLHELAGDGARNAVAFLVEHAPGNLHIVCTTRVEPTLPLARLRARDRLLEIGPAELAFTTEEVGVFLSDVMELEVAADVTQGLASRTDGWIAGLQLAALSLAHATDAEAFVQDLRGDHRHIFDYLVQEVLDSQPDEVREFLLETTILERLSAPLCGAVTGRSDAAERLQALERENLFLMPLDERRTWYRYHALFAEALRTTLERERPGAASALHRRASAWFESEGFVEEAVRHAFAAKDMEGAARLVELAWGPMDRSFRTGPWLAWAVALPASEIRRRPILGVGMAWSRLTEGELDLAARDLAAAEESLRGAGLLDPDRVPPAASAVPTESNQADAPDAPIAAPTLTWDDVPAFRTLPARIAAAKAYLAQSEGRGAEAERLTLEAMALAPQDDPGSRGIPAGLLGLSLWARGDLEGAAVALRTSAQAFHAMGDLAAALSTVFGTVETLLASGRLPEAARELETALAHAEEQGATVFPGKSEVLVAMAEVALERGEYEDVENLLGAAEGLGARGVLPGDETRLTSARAYLELALGRAGAALELLDEAERAWIVTLVPDFRPIAAVRARAWLRKGWLARAGVWLAEATDDLPADYLHAFALLTAARVHLAIFRMEDDASALEEARRILGRVLTDGGSAVGERAATEAYVLTALVREAAADKDGALDAIRRALEHAAPHGFAHVFLAEGMAVAGPLRAAQRAGVAKRHVRHLLEQLRDLDGHASVTADQVEPLTDRELDVLRLLAGSMTGPQIARQLAMSVHTLRPHTKSIYAKLGVHSRNAAVERAADLESS